MKVHSFAAMFPMLPKDRLEELAADIAEHGLAHPIIIDSDGVLLDGRNRLAACELAKVKPRFETWTGKNVEEHILSLNVHRRHISKGMMAMAKAIVHPDGERGGDRRSKKQLSNHGNHDLIHPNTLAMARAILREFGRDSDQVKAAMLGAGLDGLHEQAKARAKARAEQTALLKKLQDSIDELESGDGDFDCVDIPLVDPDIADPVTSARVKELQKKYDALREQHKERLEAEQKERATAKQIEELKAKEAELQQMIDELEPAAPLRRIPPAPPKKGLGTIGAFQANLGSASKQTLITVQKMEVLAKIAGVRDTLAKLAQEPIVDGDIALAVHTEMTHVINLACALVEVYQRGLGPRIVSQKEK